MHLIIYLQVADLSIIKNGLLSNEGMTGYILKMNSVRFTFVKFVIDLCCFTW